MDLIARLKWGALLLAAGADLPIHGFGLGLVRYPFYLDDRFGALHHTMADVAVASKFFGVLMTIVTPPLAAVIIGFIGRMPVDIGAVLAAATNLLFADLPRGGASIDAFMEWAYIADPLNLRRMGRADFAGRAGRGSGRAHGAPDAGDCGENLAGGFASVAIVATSHPS